MFSSGEAGGSSLSAPSDRVRRTMAGRHVRTPSSAATRLLPGPVVAWASMTRHPHSCVRRRCAPMVDLVMDGGCPDRRRSCPWPRPGWRHGPDGADRDPTWSSRCRRRSPAAADRPRRAPGRTFGGCRTRRTTVPRGATETLGTGAAPAIGRRASDRSRCRRRVRSRGEKSRATVRKPCHPAHQESAGARTRTAQGPHTGRFRPSRSHGPFLPLSRGRRLLVRR